MNGLKCPNCNLVNMMSATVCHRCQTSIVDLPSTAEVSVRVEETFQAQEFVQQNQPFPINNQNEISRDNKLGRKTYFWYQIYLGFMTLMYGTVSVVGGLVAFVSQDQSTYQQQENFLMGIVYAVIALPFAFIFAFGLFLPRKSWNWVVGIVYIVVSFTSCCFMPVTIPLLIYWLKPETQAYFGRK